MKQELIQEIKATVTGGYIERATTKRIEAWAKSIEKVESRYKNGTTYTDGKGQAHKIGGQEQFDAFLVMTKTAPEILGLFKPTAEVDIKRKLNRMALKEIREYYDGE